MKTSFLKLVVNLLLSSLGVLVQSYFSSLTQWIFIYFSVFVISWYGGKIHGMISTIVTLSLAGYLLIPSHDFSLHDLIELGFLAGLGFWISFLMEKYKRSLIKISANEELDKTRGFLDTLLENIPMMIFVKDAEELRFVKFNKAGLDLLGFERSDLIGKNDYDMFPSDQADFFTQKDREVLNQSSDVDIPHEIIKTRFKGERILHTKKIPVFDEKGKPLYLLGVSEDITEKIEAEKTRLKDLSDTAMRAERLRIQEREAFVAKAISSLSTTLDYDETLKRLVTIVVPSLGDWCTLTVKDDDGQFVRKASIHKDPDLQPFLDEFAEAYPPNESDKEVLLALEVGESSILREVDVDFLMSRTNGSRKLELYKKLGARSSIIVPVKVRDKILGALSIARGHDRENFDDLDLILAAEIGRRAGTVLENSLLFKSTQVAVMARDEFLSIASHELKTPITALKMQLQMLMRSSKDEKTEKPLTNAVKQIDRLTVLVDDLLNVSKIESGKMSYNFQLVLLGDLVKEALENYRNQFHFSGVELISNFQDDGEVLADKYRLEQVMINLFSNALKYGEGKPVTITVKRFTDHIEVNVKDQGKGIHPEVHQKIFGKFERGRQDLNISGLGLGLFISKEIIEAHHGSITLESSLNEGAEFKVLLPLVH